MFWRVPWKCSQNVGFGPIPWGVGGGVGNTGHGTIYMYIYVIIYDISCLKKHWISSVIPFPAFPWKLHGIVLSFDLLLGPHDVAPRASLLIAFLMHSTPGVQSVESGRGNGNDKVKQPIQSMYGIFTYTFTIQINQSCRVNIYHTCILWAMSNKHLFVVPAELGGHFRKP